jgi:hypothetical protein
MYLQIPVSPHTDTPEIAAAVRAFFAAKTNSEKFDTWHAAQESLDDLPLLRAWFYWWCYQNIAVEHEGNVFRLFPEGFGFWGDLRSVSTCESQFRHTPIHRIPLESAILRIPDPTWLYQKLGI